MTSADGSIAWEQWPEEFGRQAREVVRLLGGGESEQAHGGPHQPGP
jgi:hypothetical protein